MATLAANVFPNANGQKHFLDDPELLKPNSLLSDVITSSRHQSHMYRFSDQSSSFSNVRGEAAHPGGQ